MAYARWVIPGNNKGGGIMVDRNVYRVTIHEHRIYDSFITASSEAEAKALAEEQIMDENSAKWREDFNAGWAEVGDIYNETEEDEINAALIL